ncbi:MAG: hypothetical protein JKY48_06240 [Flavobacteriales bacterium]|nr:hypothetical protein [Flavobacteriales bacterium]
MKTLNKLKSTESYALITSYMKLLPIALLTIAMIGLSNSNLMAQKKASAKTIACPAACPGMCWYIIDIIKTPADAAGCYSASLNMFYGSTDPKCKADIDRSLGGGSVDYTLCDGTKCNLSDKNFPDGGAAPYPPGTTVPAGKVALSKPCYGAIKMTAGANGTGGGTYTFNPVKDISADFTMNIFCFCVGGDTIKDTIPYEYNIVSVPVEDTIRTGGDTRPVDGNGHGKNNDGTNKGSYIKQANTIHNSTGYAIESIYPNPVEDQFNVRLTIDAPEQFQFTLIDGMGNWIQNDVINLPEGKNDIPIKLNNGFKSGQYYYLLIHRKSGEFSTTKLLIK